MKTLQDCKDKVARPYGALFETVAYAFRGTDLPHKLLDQAAELYGRYMRFVGYLEGKEEMKRWGYKHRRGEIDMDLVKVFGKIEFKS